MKRSMTLVVSLRMIPVWSCSGGGFPREGFGRFEQDCVRWQGMMFLYLCEDLRVETLRCILREALLDVFTECSESLCVCCASCRYGRSNVRIAVEGDAPACMLRCVAEKHVLLLHVFTVCMLWLIARSSVAELNDHVMTF